MNKRSGLLLEWNNLSCVFGGRTVFCGFSGTLAEGERVRVTAPSGCGKTSFLSMLLGFLVPSSGTIFLEGTPLASVPTAKLRAAMAAVPQEVDFGQTGTVQEALLQPFSYRLNRLCKPSVETLAAACRRFLLPDGVLSAAVSSLSGGEKQRIACIIALLLPRRILLLDEPFSALDAASAQRVADAFAADRNRALLYVTHTDVVPDFATRTIPLEACHG